MKTKDHRSSYNCTYRTLFPSGPLPCFLSLQLTIMQSKATGIADHILPLGDLFLFSPLLIPDSFAQPNLSVNQTFLGSGPEGLDDLCFYTSGNFLLLLLLLLLLHPPPSPRIPVLRPNIQSLGPNSSLDALIPSLEAQIKRWRPRSQP